jgi:hypothetical protein
MLFVTAKFVNSRYEKTIASTASGRLMLRQPLPSVRRTNGWVEVRAKAVREN